MNVGELIGKLSKLDKNLEVVITSRTPFEDCDRLKFVEKGEFTYGIGGNRFKPALDKGDTVDAVMLS